MTRRLLAAASLVAVIGGFGAAALPAHADTPDGYVCIGMNDKKNPGYMDALCIDEWINIGNRG